MSARIDVGLFFGFFFGFPSLALLERPYPTRVIFVANQPKDDSAGGPKHPSIGKFWRHKVEERGTMTLLQIDFPSHGPLG